MPVLVVQMGHSGRTSGATGAPGEMAYTEAVGASCARLLGRDGWVVRPIVADPPSSQYRGDAFVAVHADGSNNPAVRGASVGYQNTPGLNLAHEWRARYIARGFTGPWHPDNYTTNLARYYGVTEALRQGNIRACIIECGTITNAEDRALMAPDRVALAIGDALGIQFEEENVALTDPEIERVWRWDVDDYTQEPAGTMDAYQALGRARQDAFMANVKATEAVDALEGMQVQLDRIEAKLDAHSGGGATP